VNQGTRSIKKEKKMRRERGIAKKSEKEGKKERKRENGREREREGRRGKRGADEEGLTERVRGEKKST
jgi:hypothetical protein